MSSSVLRYRVAASSMNMDLSLDVWTFWRMLGVKALSWLCGDKVIRRRSVLEPTLEAASSLKSSVTTSENLIAATPLRMWRVPTEGILALRAWVWEEG